MDKADAEHKLLKGIDTLAAVEHERWAHWQRYMHSKGTRLADGSLQLSGDLIARWEKQIATPFAELTQEEKDSDRDQVRVAIPIIASLLGGENQQDRS
jgi:hypothetical protein